MDAVKNLLARLAAAIGEEHEMFRDEPVDDGYVALSVEQEQESSPPTDDDFIEAYNGFVKRLTGAPHVSTRNDLFLGIAAIDIAESSEHVNRYWWVPVHHPFHVRAKVTGHATKRYVEHLHFGKCCVYKDDHFTTLLGEAIQIFHMRGYAF